MRVVAADNSSTAPALYFADASYTVPRIDDAGYVDALLDICRKENVGAVTTLIDPEIAVLAKNRDAFEREGVLVLAPSPATAEASLSTRRPSRAILPIGASRP